LKQLSEKDFEFSYKRAAGVVYLCVTSKDTKKRVVLSLLDDVEKQTKGLHQQKKKAKEIIKQLIKKWNDPSSDLLTETQNKVEEVKGIMLENIDKVLERGEKLETIEEESEQVAKLGEKFKKGAKTFRNQMCARLCFYILLLVFVILAIIVAIVLVILFAVCGPPKFTTCIPWQSGS